MLKTCFFEIVFCGVSGEHSVALESASSLPEPYLLSLIVRKKHCMTPYKLLFQELNVCTNTWIEINNIFMVPTIIYALLMFCLYFCTHMYAFTWLSVQFKNACTHSCNSNMCAVKREPQ